MGVGEGMLGYVAAACFTHQSAEELYSFVPAHDAAILTSVYHECGEGGMVGSFALHLAILRWRCTHSDT